MTPDHRATILYGVELPQFKGPMMACERTRIALLLSLALLTACASATDRLNDGITLQSQGRYIEAVYRYADAVEKDGDLSEAQDRLLAAGDTALLTAMDEADALERRGDPLQAAAYYYRIDQMLARVREVGLRLTLPGDYSGIRRAIFDTAINRQMVKGDESAEDGRWEEARGYYVDARGDYLPSRNQVQESYDAETRVLLSWADVELVNGQPRFAHGLAQEALEVRVWPSRETVLAVRDLQEQALAEGTVVLAILPVIGDRGARDFLGGEFEIQLDRDLSLDHWNRPPLFIEVADPLILRTGLRGLLRGQVMQTPLIVGRALDLIGADLGVIVRLSGVEVVEERVDVDEHDAVVRRSTSGRGRGRVLGRDRNVDAQPDQVMDTVTYTTRRGVLSYFVEAEIVLVDNSGREVSRFRADSRQRGRFERGEFNGDPSALNLEGDRARFFDPAVLAEQAARIEGRVLEELAIAIAVGTFDQVLSGIR
jgi:tetratricopeptide (TPR) repeat protein